MAILAAASLAFAACSQDQAGQAEAQTPVPQVTADSGVVQVGGTVADFTLADQNGVEHELYSMNDANAVVLVMQGNGCPIVQKMLPTLKEVAAEYGERNVEFLMINSNFQDKPDGIKKEAEKFELDMPIMKDTDQTIGKYLGAVRTAEVFIIDPDDDWKLIYHGPIDDRLTYGREKAVADNHFVRDMLDAMLEGRELPHPEKQQADGCLINYV